ncbi:Autophagy-related protein 2 [Podosphaera aphanis]|nr:Autophagy-related protein 2 [Podosphaera aphanis]
MNSYFHSYFHASSMPKRLLQYVLSRLEILDTDTLDLEDLNVALGKNSSIEFRNVGLRLKKLDSLLHLPACLKLSKACILLLRLTIPVDIYSSSILIEVEGLDFQLQIKAQDDEIPSQSEPGPNSVKNLATEYNRFNHREDEENKDKELPSVTDIAQSFLQTEPEEGKAKLAAAISSEIEEAGTKFFSSDEKDVLTGTGASLTTPTFMARFLQGIIDRLQVNVQNVNISFNFDVPYKGSGPLSPLESKDSVTIRLAAQNIVIEGVTQIPKDKNIASDMPGSGSRPGKRLVYMSQIRGYLISDTKLSSSLENSPAMSYSSNTCLNPSSSIVKAFDESLSSNHGPSSNVSGRRPQSPRLSARLSTEPLLKLSQHRISQSHSLLSDNLLYQSEIESELDPKIIMHSCALEQDNLHDEDSTVSNMEEDLTQSRLFTHDEAESMYTSAISYKFSQSRNFESQILSNVDSNVVEYLSQSSDFQIKEKAEHFIPSKNKNLEASSTGLPSLNTTEKIQVPDVSPTQSDPPDTPVTRLNQSSPKSNQIFELDRIEIYVPSTLSDSSVNTTEAEMLNSISSSGCDAQGESMSLNVPGAFSLQASNQKSSSIKYSRSTKRGEIKTESENNMLAIEINVGNLNMQFDAVAGKLALKLAIQAAEIYKSVSTSKSSFPEQESMSNSILELNVKEISLKFFDRLEDFITTPPKASELESYIPDILLQTNFVGFHLKSQRIGLQTETSISLKKLRFGYKEENIVSFDANERPKSSIQGLDSSATNEISIHIMQTTNTTHVEVSTLPLHISINLQKLDETFSWFGGLSSVLSLGSSIVSNKTVIASTAHNSKARGVRFDTPSQPEVKSLAAHNKANIRIGGLKLDLKGSECGLKLETSAIKTVIRDEAVGFSIQNIQLSAPHLYQSQSSPAIIMELDATRVEFLSAPKDSDLDRLLSLITPSKTKYGLNDDILLDTLLRQRNKGAVLRLTIDHLTTKIEKLNELSYLPELSEEVSRLATVANYLPDDDRPGLLSLILIREIDCQFDSAHKLGTISFSLAEFEIAQINLPALLAISIGDVSVTRDQDEKMLGIAIDPDIQESSDKGPVVMARMIGNEMEPVIKVKLSNLNLEYRVPTILSLIEFIESCFSLEIPTSVSASAATLTGLSIGPTSFSSLLRASKVHGDSIKPLAIDIDLRNCVLGLNPLGLPSKVAFVLSEAYFGAVFSKDQSINDSFHVELKKASILVVDNVENLTGVKRISKRPRSFDGGSSQVAFLCGIGYVSVGFISSAKAIIHRMKNGGEQTFHVEIRDDLLVLESCADSTQTLIAAIHGLTPPNSLPSKEDEYRTTIIPIDDLLASLSTDAFGTAEGDYNFDDDFGLIDGFESDFPCEFDEDKECDPDAQYYYHHKTSTETEETGHPTDIFSRDTQDGVLLENLSEPRESEDDAELEFRENHFGPGSVLEGPDHRWNSVNNTYDRSNPNNVRRIPLKVCVRDVHVIWNLFDGYDWQQTRDTISKAVQNVETKATERRARNEMGPLQATFDNDDEASVIEDFLFNSIYIGVPANRDPRDLTSAINQDLNDNATETESVATTAYPSTIKSASARNSRASRLQLNRSRHHKITFELQGIYADFITFPPGSGETQNTLDIRIRDFDIFDHVPTSTWRKFATYMQDAGERETGSSMIHLEIINVKPVAELSASEMVLKATILPLRLHVDQDALDFITRFFEFKDDAAPARISRSEEPFLQRVEVNSIKVRLDFKPKRVNYAGLRSGRTTEFMNFLILDEADMELRHTIIYGISGFEKLGKCLNDIWMPDVKRNQLPSILAGLAPVKSLVNVGDGFRHLIVVPMREYKKDGRIVRSISKGATAFAKVTGTELVKLGAKVAIGVQTVLQGAEGLLSNTSESSVTTKNNEIEEEQKQISLYANQPIGVIQGFRGGYDGLQRDLIMARDAIIAVPGEVMESGTAVGALKAVGKYAPTVILRPAIGVAKAGGQILMGATNTLDPVNLQRAEAKYKKH